MYDRKQVHTTTDIQIEKENKRDASTHVRALWWRHHRWHSLHGHSLRCKPRRWRRWVALARIVHWHTLWRWWWHPRHSHTGHTSHSHRRHHLHTLRRWHPSHLHRHATRHNRLLWREPRWRRWLGKSTGELTLIGALHSGHGWTGAESDGCGWWAGGNWESIVFASLSSEKTLGGSSMAFALAVLFESVLNGDSLVHEELAIHGFDGCIRRFEVCVRHKPIAF